MRTAGERRESERAGEGEGKKGRERGVSEGGPDRLVGRAVAGE